MVFNELELNKLLVTKTEFINRAIGAYFASPPRHLATIELWKSLRYSSESGGKRFRPALSLMVTDLFSIAAEQVLPYALSVEFIHTYSLIHDDLPCMDDDDMRRGRPTNHKVFGESTALLAGDSLLTEAFINIANAYQYSPALAVKLSAILGHAAGRDGMIAGQVIDIQAQKNHGTRLSMDDLITMHRLKTGALIRSSLEGAAEICSAAAEQKEHLANYGEWLGLAFQVKDDLLDHDESQPEMCSFTYVLGLQETAAYLQTISDKAATELSPWGAEADNLRAMIAWNQTRNN